MADTQGVTAYCPKCTVHFWPSTEALAGTVAPKCPDCRVEGTIDKPIVSVSAAGLNVTVGG